MVSSYPKNLKALNWFLGLETLFKTQDQGSPHCAFQRMCLRVMQLLNFVPSHTTFFLFSIQTRNMTVCYCIHYPELYLTQVVALCSSYVIYRTELLYSLKHKNLVWIAYLAIFQPFERGNEELKSIEIFFYMLYIVSGGRLALIFFDFMTSKFFLILNTFPFSCFNA
jgi:hypothetical protein